ncbi:MarR family transcriptional regulator [Streptomyces sp. A73]|nr:MarR family transcriptional regulator [Streptomyces sp. RK75]MBQ1121711.1 MarR family transcriptional regulator [Streptomyces sp. B15]MBQ1158120.1 MarR family transcriptional regulator [Streptomyces sp. A73]
MPAGERLGSYIKDAANALMTTKHAVLRPSGLTVAQYAALLQLAENPGMPAAALARACRVTAPTMNTILKNLQQRGLITRTPHSWHRNVLETRLTEAGAEAVAEADRSAVRVERGLAAEFTDEERAQLIALLERCERYLESVRPE